MKFKLNTLGFTNFPELFDRKYKILKVLKWRLEFSILLSFCDWIRVTATELSIDIFFWELMGWLLEPKW